MTASHAVAGIDIGGDRKGCHLVILRGTRLLCQINSTRPDDMLAACLEHDVTAVGIDAPCQWRSGPAARQAERLLAQQRIFSFSTPTRERAEANTSGFYKWMFNGLRMYEAFLTRYSMFNGRAENAGRVCFETFPHAITCAMLGNDVASAKKKREQRRLILANAGVDTSALKSIDAIDAALCALTANRLLDRQVVAYGDDLDGYIVVPRSAKRIVRAAA
jgi:predicted nuclease with RNAse H fold